MRAKRTTLTLVAICVLFLTPGVSKAGPSSWTVEEVALTEPVDDWDVAVDASGTVALAVATSSFKGGRVYLFTRSESATSFSTPVVLHSGEWLEESLAEGRSVNVEVSPDGYALVMWVLQDGIRVVLGNIRTGVWGRVQRLGNPLSGAATAGIADSGVVTVAWTTLMPSYVNGKATYQSRVVSVRGDASSDTWSRPTRFRPAAGVVFELAVNDAGDAVLAWSRCVAPSLMRCLDPDRYDLLFDVASVVETVFRPATSSDWESRQVVTRGRYLNNWDVALDNDGDAVVVWQRPTPSGVGGAVLASTSARDDRWVGPSRISSSAAQFRQTDFFNTVAVVSSGRETVAAWVASNATGEFVETGELSATGTWSEARVEGIPCPGDCLGELKTAASAEETAIAWSVPASATSGGEGPSQLHVLILGRSGRVLAPALEASSDEGLSVAIADREAVVTWADLAPGYDAPGFEPVDHRIQVATCALTS